MRRDVPDDSVERVSEGTGVMNENGDDSGRMNEDHQHPGLKNRNPLNGAAILGGLLGIVAGIGEPQSGTYMIAGSILVSGGLIAYSLESRH